MNCFVVVCFQFENNNTQHHTVPRWGREGSETTPMLCTLSACLIVKALTLCSAVCHICHICGIFLRNYNGYKSIIDFIVKCFYVHGLTLISDSHFSTYENQNYRMYEMQCAITEVTQWICNTCVKRIKCKRLGFRFGFRLYDTHLFLYICIPHAHV